MINKPNPEKSKIHKLPMKRTINLCITGACGNIAFSLFGMIFNSEPFGPNVTINLRLLDLPSKMNHMKAIKTEL